jgi:DNA processing protein
MSVLDVVTPRATAPRLAPQPAVEASATHEMVMKLLSISAVTVDEILRQCQLSPAALSMILLDLELAGRLQRHPGNAVSLRA